MGGFPNTPDTEEAVSLDPGGMNSGPGLPFAHMDLTLLNLHPLQQIGLTEPESFLTLQDCSCKDQCLGVQGLVE